MKKALVAITVFTSLVSVNCYADTTPAEMAGICAGNALYIYNTSKNVQGLEQVALAAQSQMTKNFERYKTQPGFDKAAAFAYNQQSTREQRIQVAINCAKAGY